MADNRTEQQRVKEITDKLEEGLKELFESEKYKSYLNTMSKFHNYSFNNTLLIAMQKPEATLVAGYKAWQKNFDRHVNKGEKAIRILAPAPYKIKEERDKLDPVTGELLFDENGMPQKEKVEITIPAFRPVSVFDVSQTDGKPIPELETAELLQTVEGYEDFVKALMEVAPVPIDFEDIPGESKGYFHTEEKRIAVQENMSESQTLKTMVHEVAHSMLHNKELNKDMDTPVKDRNTKEVEAESIAYTVCQHFGIDTSDYSFGYIAGWSSSKEMTELKASLDTIRRTASELITGIEGQLQALQLERAMEQAQEKESLLLVQTTDLSEYSLLNVRGMDAQELVEALADMSGDDKLSVQAYLESKGAWTTEITNQDTKEFEEYHLDVRYFMDRDEIVDVSKVREQQAEENLSVMEKAEALIGALEANKTLFTSEERNLIMNYAYKTDDFDKTKALAQKLALTEDKGLAGAGKVMAEAQAEIDELPDPMIGLYEMHDYGYDWSEMLPLTKDRALELWDDDYPIYLLHVDGSETMADDREEIEEHGGIFGIEKEDWMRERSLDRDNDMEQENEVTQPVAEETVSEEKSQDTYRIYQLKSDDELWQYHFESLESLKAHDLKVEGKNYELKYEGEWTEGMHLEGIYTKFNIDRPEDFTGHSLSVGDIVVLNRDGKETAHFVDSVGFVEVPEFFLESAIEQEITEEKAMSGLAEQTVGIEDGDEIIDLGDDREAVLAEIRGSKENEVQETEVKDTSGQDVQKQKPEVEITLTVAECGEFHNMGEFYENIPIVEEAIALFEKIPPERMNGIPAIGINLHRAGEDVENDIAIDIAGAKSIDLDVLQYVPDIANEPKAMEVVAELIAKLPDREIDGNLSTEFEAKVWEKRMPQLSEEERLAVEFDRLCFDYDRILYHDTVRNMSENVEELSQEVKTEGTERISDILREIVAEGVVPEEVERAKELLDKLSEYKPLAKVEEVEEQNYNMIDNVLNNGAEKAKKEADRKEMDKPRGRVSLKERLAEKKAIIAGNDKAAETQENVKKNQREM